MAQDSINLQVAGSGCCRGGASPSVLSYIAVPLRIALGGLFLFAAYNKVFIENGPQLFAASIKAFKLFEPEQYPAFFQLSVYATPWIEILAGIGLVLGLFTRASAAVISGLLLFFIAIIAYVISQGMNTPCGCFGKISPFCPEKITYCNIVQNVVLLTMAALVLVAPKHLYSVDSLLCGAGKKKCGCKG